MAQNKHREFCANERQFSISVEIVPPQGPDAKPLLHQLNQLSALPIDAFSVATNPVATPRMSALALCALIQQKTGRPTILHCTTRDHNSLGLQAALWGARALGIDKVLATTGDFVALKNRSRISTVRDLNLFDLICLARDTELLTGVVFDPYGDAGGLDRAAGRLEQKVSKGAEFVVTQPLYDMESAIMLREAIHHIKIPVILGILPLRTPRHAEFLHQRVAGIVIPRSLRERIKKAKDPVAEGAANAREMVAIARKTFQGVCIMPPFDHYEVLFDILSPGS